MIQIGDMVQVSEEYAREFYMDGYLIHLIEGGEYRQRYVGVPGRVIKSHEEIGWWVIEFIDDNGYKALMGSPERALDGLKAD